jgi:VWFA-related protein
MFKTRMFTLIAVITLSSLPALAQEKAAIEPPAAILTSRSTLVQVPALVETYSGELVFDLTAKDFIVTDDGVEQKIVIDEDTGGEPLALVILVETGGEGARHLANYRHLGPSIESVIGAVRNRVAVVEFDGSPRIVQGFTEDLNAVGDTLDNLEDGDRKSAIFDSLRFSVDLLRRQPPNFRRAILLISETVDHGSQSTLDQTLRDVGDTNTAIYSLHFSSGKSATRSEVAQTFSSSQPGPAGGCMSRGSDVDPNLSRSEQTYDCLSLLAPPMRIAKAFALLAVDGLKHNAAESVAKLTGGESFSFKDARTLQHDVQTISHHLPNRYLLSFQPAAPHPGFHSIGLKLKDHPDLIASGRSSYWADE